MSEETRGSRGWTGWRLLRRSLSPAILAGCLIAGPALAHTVGGPQQVPLAGKRLQIRTDPTNAKSNKLMLSVSRQALLDPETHDPSVDGFDVLVRSGDPNGQRTPLITLDPSAWKIKGRPGKRRLLYLDRTLSRGGIQKVLIKSGRVKLVARGQNWPWHISGGQSSVWVHLYMGDEEFCLQFGGEVIKNEVGRFVARNAPALVSCPAAVCGNGRTEVGEDCDDGNLDQGDTCNNKCETLCEADDFASTFDAIQEIIFDSPVYGCTSTICHGSAPGLGGLDLSAGAAFGNLVGVPSSINPGIKRVEPGEHELSVLWEKLRAGTEGGLPAFGGTAMPTGATPLSLQHLEAIELWIRGGASSDLVISGTSQLLAACLPPPDPLVIVAPDPPGAGVGIQLRQTPRPLVGEAESEICMSTYYDFTQTGLVPESAKQSCSIGIDNNPSGECFLVHRRLLAQDPQSHHSILHVYKGIYDDTHPAWGPWTYKFRDANDPLDGATCDPTLVDPNTGYNANCSSAITPSVGCTGYGPPDGGIFFANNFLISQEVYFNQEFADGAYQLLPMAGIFTWNSHAFNTHTADSALDQYLNLEFAAPADQVNLVEDIFDISQIFIANVPPFEQREYCNTYLVPSGASLFHLTTHTHQRGVEFRVWEPPNGSCAAGENGAAGACSEGPGSRLIYQSFDYDDPVQLYFDPPDLYSGNANSRRFLYCARYDNGSTVTSPSVKRNSNPVGSGCSFSKRACMAGPQKGQLCGGNDSFCDTSAGAGDGECDACPAVGGVTTEDEMFLLLGSYF